MQRKAERTARNTGRISTNESLAKLSALWELNGGHGSNNNAKVQTALTHQQLKDVTGNIGENASVVERQTIISWRSRI